MSAELALVCSSKSLKLATLASIHSQPPSTASISQFWSVFWDYTILGDSIILEDDAIHRDSSAVIVSPVSGNWYVIAG